MYPIVRRERFDPTTFLVEVRAPHIAKACEPGQFVMVRLDETGERIPLTIADFDRETGTVTLVVQAVGKTTYRMMELREGEALLNVVGPLGLASHLEQRRTVVLVGGGLGVAPIFPQLRRHKELGSRTISVVGFRSVDRMFWLDRFEAYSDDVLVATEDGSYGCKGYVTVALERALDDHDDIDEVIAVGPIAMMKACAELTRPRGILTTASLNPIMIDGTGMCGSCRVTVDGAMRFACVDGPDFDAHRVDFDELALRMRRFEHEERDCLLRLSGDEGGAGARGIAAPAAGGRTFPFADVPVPIPDPPPLPGTPLAPKNAKAVAPTRVPMPAQCPEERVRNFDEVATGYDLASALAEADRCIRCKKPKCIEGCPVEVDIPAFIAALTRKDLESSYRILRSGNVLPAVCGRVCPQELQCESTCILGKKREPVAVGRLERFVADFGAGRGWEDPADAPPSGKRVAIIGSGPAGLACAGDLVRAGVEVTVYEALHVAGGVLKYGIPEFRLPNDTIDIEIETLSALGVRFEVDTVIGRVFTVPQLLSEMGFDAVFIGTGAGSPTFLGIPGEGLNGVVSANEFLTRVNLMQGFRRPTYDTPVGLGRRVAVVGAGNTAMDACRVALRLGAEKVWLVYRRTEAEAPARAEELRHAIEEGVECLWLTSPTQILGDAEGWVSGVEVIANELGEPDASGRARPIPKPGSERLLDADMVIPALGTSVDPVIARTTEGLATDERRCIEVDATSQMTSMPGVFAGGDVVTGSATVILAMGAGRRAATGILGYLGLAPASADVVAAA
jgi:homotetrameric NADPH-dependent glutamate synthase